MVDGDLNPGLPNFKARDLPPCHTGAPISGLCPSFLNTTDKERFAQGTSWENNGSCNQLGQHSLWFLSPGTVSTLSRPFHSTTTEYK